MQIPTMLTMRVLLQSKSTLDGFKLQHWSIKTHYWSLDGSESAALDLFRYQAVTDGNGDPAAWPQCAEERSTAVFFIFLTPTQPKMNLMREWRGECCWGRIRLQKQISIEMGWVEVRGAGHLDRPDKGAPAADVYVTLWMSFCLTISSADTNCLISQLISNSKHRSLQQIPEEGGDCGVAN